MHGVEKIISCPHLEVHDFLVKRSFLRFCASFLIFFNNIFVPLRFLRIAKRLVGGKVVNDAMF